MSLGSNIKEIRKKRLMTQKELSEKTKIKIAHISRIENDDGDLKLSTIYKIMEALECTPNEMLLNDSAGINTQISAKIEKINNLPVKLKQEVESILDKYIFYGEMISSVMIAQKESGISIDEIEKYFDSNYEKNLEMLKSAKE